MLNYESMNVNSKKETTIAALITFGQAKLKAAGIGCPKKETMELLSFFGKVSKAAILANPDATMRAPKEFIAAIEKRAKHVPLQYLLGTEYFAGLELLVGPGVLIPRPETELIIDYIKRSYSEDSDQILVDLGTGSGNLALALAAHYPQWQVVAIDRSEKALYYARKNRQRYQIKNVRFLKMYWFSVKWNFNLRCLVGRLA
jgi:release factor glutamine methyltransferase